MHSRSQPVDVHKVSAVLRDMYGDFDHYNKKNPLRELIFIICSLQTDQGKYTATYRALMRRFPSFRDLSQAPEVQIAQVIAPGGLARQKARAINRLLRAVAEEFGKPSLAQLRHMPDEECERFLRALPGVGTKTARCVMMYSLQRRVFPVDTHCWRISRRLGWVRPTRPDLSCSPKDMDRLQGKIPERLRFSLHVNMVSLGREVCLPGTPRCASCAIEEYCRKVGVSRSRKPAPTA